MTGSVAEGNLVYPARLVTWWTPTKPVLGHGYDYYPSRTGTRVRIAEIGFGIGLQPTEGGSGLAAAEWHTNESGTNTDAEAAFDRQLGRVAKSAKTVTARHIPSPYESRVQGSWRIVDSDFRFKASLPPGNRQGRAEPCAALDGAVSELLDRIDARNPPRIVTRVAEKWEETFHRHVDSNRGFKGPLDLADPCNHADQAGDGGSGPEDRDGQ
jgi:hypothetical protein